MIRPFISVIIPTYNRAEALKASLASLTAQTLSKDQYEIIVVNDGSTDDTPAICAAFAAELPLKYFAIDNSGISAATNLGIFAATSPLLLFFNDDVATPTLLEAHLKAHSQHPDENVAILGYTTWHPSLQVTEVMRYVIDIGDCLFSYANFHDGKELDFTFFCGGRTSCKRSLLVRNGVFRQDLRFGTGDIELAYRLSRFGLRVVFSRRAVQYMNRPVTYDEVCRRCEEQGASLYHLSRIHNDPTIAECCQVATANKFWNQVRDPMGMGFYRVRELEAMSKSSNELGVLQAELHRLYKWTFGCFRMRGVICAQQATSDGIESAAIKTESVISPIVVFQMGKVGSKTIEASLKASDPMLPVCHSHLLHDLDSIEEHIKASRDNPGPSLMEVDHGRQLRKTLLGTDYIRCRVISLVRDPVARNVSAFFENIREFVPDFYTHSADDQIDVERIIWKFLGSFDHDTPLIWFDKQMNPVFGIDVFACPFSKQRGFTIYQGQNASLLLLKLEKLKECAGAAFKEFLGIDELILTDVNVAEGKEYRKIYKAFLDAVRLPSEYLDRMYESKLVRHFYTDDEIASLRARWVKHSAPAAAPL